MKPAVLAFGAAALAAAAVVCSRRQAQAPSPALPSAPAPSMPTPARLEAQSSQALAVLRSPERAAALGPQSSQALAVLRSPERAARQEEAKSRGLLISPEASKSGLDLVRSEAGVSPLNVADRPGQGMDQMLNADAGEILSRQDAPILSYFGIGGDGRFSVKILRSQKAFDDLNNELGIMFRSPIDFKRMMAVALYGGDMPKGRKVEIVSAAEENGRFSILYRKTNATAQDVASFESERYAWRPIHVVVVARSNLPTAIGEVRSNAASQRPAR
ncbi:MAG: hypothetical protein HY922_00225 [Elusimicrobia bacterium]|nr:hypothetical protein [Elusimicrobiota bacterium]